MTAVVPAESEFQPPRVESIGDALTVATRQTLKARLLDYLAAGERDFLLDFSETAYVDASGQGVLVTIANRVNQANGRLVLCGLNANLVKLFALTHIDTLFLIVPSREDALRFLAAERQP